MLYQGSFLKAVLDFQITVKQGECQSDPECPDDRACIDLQCLDPCREYDPCAQNAICMAQGHRAVCKCPSGWAGDPHAGCFQCRFLEF